MNYLNYINKYSLDNIKTYFTLIYRLQNLNLINDQNEIVNQKLELVSRDINKFTKTLNNQLTDNLTIQQCQIEKLNNLDQSYPVTNSSDYFDLIKNQNNINLRNKKTKELNNIIDQIKIENNLLTNTLNNCEEYNSLTEMLSENYKEEIHQSLKIIFNSYEQYFLLNFINQKVIVKAIKNSQFNLQYNYSFLFVLIEIIQMIIVVYILMHTSIYFFNYHL